MGEIDLIIAMIVGAGLVIFVGGGASQALEVLLREPHQKAQVAIARARSGADRRRGRRAHR
jgi:hypothetical protein